MKRSPIVIAVLLLLTLGLLAQVSNISRIVYKVDARTIASNGSGSAATLTLTPTGSYVAITCNDPDTCAITMGESSIPDGMPVTVVNMSTNPITFSDTAGVSELTAATSLSQYQTLTLIYRSDRWVEVARATTLTVFTYRFPMYICDPGGAYHTTQNVRADFPVLTCLGSTDVEAGYLQFVDGGGTHTIYQNFHLPADWTSTIDLTLLWFSPATTGNVVWTIRTACAGNGETLNPSWNTAQTITDATQGVASRLNKASLTGLTTTGCAADEELFLQVQRDGSVGGDTITNDANLLELEMTYRRAM